LSNRIVLLCKLKSEEEEEEEGVERLRRISIDGQIDTHFLKQSRYFGNLG